MSYLLIAIALYALSVFWIGVCMPWLNVQMRDQARWLREQELARQPKQELARQPKPEPRRAHMSAWVRNGLALIKRVNVQDITDSIISVQPMTGRLGRIHHLDAVESRRLRFTGSPELDILQAARDRQGAEAFQQSIANLLKAQHGI